MEFNACSKAWRTPSSAARFSEISQRVTRSGHGTTRVPVSSPVSALTPAEPLFQADGHGVARLLRDRPAHLGLDRQLVGAVSRGHERAAEGMTVDGASDLDEAPGAAFPQLGDANLALRIFAGAEMKERVDDGMQLADEQS